MGGGGGGGDAESYTSNIPKWAKGAHQELINFAQQEAYDRPFPIYGDARIAQFSPYEEAAFGAQQEMFERGDPLGDFAAQQAMAPGYQKSDFDFGTFDQSRAQEYMNPYMQSVVEAEKRAALDEYSRQKMRSDAERVASGARGGYREAVEQAVGRAQQGRVMSEIQGRGSERSSRSGTGMRPSRRRVWVICLL